MTGPSPFKFRRTSAGRYEVSLQDGTVLGEVRKYQPNAYGAPSYYSWRIVGGRDEGWPTKRMAAEAMRRRAWGESY